MKVNIIGTALGQTGYDLHTRQLANALVKEGIDVCLTVNKSQGWERWVNDDELKMLNSSPHDSNVNLFIGMPPFWCMNWNEDKPFIGFVVWEGDKVPIGWIDILKDKRVSQIWVPSQHTKDAIRRTIEDVILQKMPAQVVPEGEELQVQVYPEEGFIMHKIKIVPHGVDLTKFYPNPQPHDKFTFVFNGGWPAGTKDRKGLSFLLKAYLEEFTSKDNVRMLVKINSAYGMNDQVLNKNMSELNIQNTDKPDLNFVFDNLQYEVLNKFYNNGDVFVISSLAEAFHLGGLEAMACGLPVVYTNYGGQTEYCNESNGWELKEGKMIPVSWDNMYEEVCWKIPKIDEIRRILREIYNNQHQIQAKVPNTLETAKRFTWNESAKKAKVFLSSMLL